MKKFSELSENAVRYEALTAMKEIQAQISAISLLGVLGVMREENPLRQNILDMEAQLHDLSATMGEFISDNIADVESEEGEAEDVAPEPEKEEKPKKEEKKTVKVKKEPKEDVEAPEEDEKPKEEENDKEEQVEENFKYFSSKLLEKNKEDKNYKMHN